MGSIRVVVDGRALGGASSFRGLGTYLRLLLAHLSAEADLQLTVLAPAGVELPEGTRVVSMPQRGPDRWATAEHHRRVGRALARTAGPRHPGSAQAPAQAPAPVVFHSPALDPPHRVPGPWVQTIPDVLPLAGETAELSVERRRWRSWADRVRSATAVIALSSHSAGQAVELLGVDPARVSVIHLAADPRYHPADRDGPGRPPARDEPGRAPGRAAGIEATNDSGTGPYLLYVGEHGPHKGFTDAALVMARLVREGFPHRLVVAGRVAGPRRSEIERELSAGGARARARIELRDWVPDLLPLYQQADALVASSRHEGFGLPAVEAMACGLPVVAYRNSAQAEVVAGGGTLVADGDPGALASALGGILSDPGRWQAARHAGLRRSAAFSWADTGRRHLEVYRQAAG